ncbi:hypothetical protein V8C86DRAFT_1787664 [Haematococcus lacustris]
MVLAACTPQADAGPLTALATYGACQSGCNIAVASCYTVAGGVFGVAAIPACGAAQGVCMAACAQMTLAAIVAPTP